MKPAILARTELHRGWARYLRVRVRLPGGDEVDREVEDHGAAVCVLPYDPVRRMATFVRQFRTPVFMAAGVDSVLEAPAGLLEDAPEDCARREAMEETGLRLGVLEPVTVGWTMPGISTERMHFYLAAYGEADRVAPGGGLAAEHEDIEVVELPLREVAALAASGGIADVKTLMLASVLQLRHPALFA